VYGSGRMKKYVPIKEIKEGSIFKAPKTVKVSEETLVEAERWWKTRIDEVKVKIYLDCLEALSEWGD